MSRRTEPAAPCCPAALQECKHTLRHHKDKVQAVAWNPAEAPVMLTGGFDRLAALADVRAVGSCASWAVSRDVEALTWCPHAPTCFLVSSEDGLVAPPPNPTPKR